MIAVHQLLCKLNTYIVLNPHDEGPSLVYSQLPGSPHAQFVSPQCMCILSFAFSLSQLFRVWSIRGESSIAACCLFYSWIACGKDIIDDDRIGKS